jgi:cytochrome c peroxidase
MKRKIGVLVSVIIPLGLDLYLPVPDDSPLTAEQIELGRQLFSDTRLSADGTVVCATCHDPARAFSSEAPLAVGVFGRVGRRNAPAIVNRAYGTSFSWDGRMGTLEEQVLAPIDDPLEMGSSREEAAARVDLTPEALARALASFVRSILSGNSRYDRFADGDRDALSDDERAGLRLFRTKAGCTACHIGPTLTDEAFHNTGVAWVVSDAAEAGRFRDEGRAGVTGRDADRGAFKTPTLREVARTAPYMHDGSFATLEEVVEFYDVGGRQNPRLDPEIRRRHLTTEEKRQLVAFLKSLGGG